MAITLKGENEPGKPKTISNIYVRSDGSFSKNLPNGYKIVGEFGNFVDSALNPLSSPAISVSYRDPSRRRIYQRKLYLSDSYKILSHIMHFGSYYDSVEHYKESAERLSDRADNFENFTRGASLSRRPPEDLSADLRLYVDDLDLTGRPEAATEVNCTGMRCTAAIGEQQRNLPVLTPGDFIPTFPEGASYNHRVRPDGNWVDTHMIMQHRGIYLTLDGSGKNVIDSPLSFGAWMDDAGFFVATRGTLENEGKERAARMVVAVGAPTGRSPDADAVWRGSMVGSVKQGEAKDHLLRGDAALSFDVNSSTLSAHFFYIKDFDRFGDPHKIEEVQKGNKSRLIFKRIPVAADGSYARTYDSGKVNSGGNIRGNFYGDGHGETAGTFEKFGVIGAFGAKKVTG